ncbi:MAG: hypothetical protein K9M03_01855 [Kiritimatiellales bacterium]|nr:hypothetical protein [Kiritimatiellales bacterium]
MKAVKYQLSHPRAEVNIPKSDSSHLQSIVYKKLMHMYELSETDLNKINSDMNIWPNSVQASIKDAIRLWPFYKNKLMQLSEKGKDGDIKNSDIRAGLLYSKKVTDMMNEVSQILEDYTQGILN